MVRLVALLVLLVTPWAYADPPVCATGSGVVTFRLCPGPQVGDGTPDGPCPDVTVYPVPQFIEVCTDLT